MKNTLTEAVKIKIEEAESISILSHLNPDPDALGTALGIYACIKQDKRKKIEIVNGSKVLPKYLDFLPGYGKIKHQMEYSNSLIIACDCGSVDRLGFDLSGRDIINIDHHKSNTNYGSINVVVKEHVSSSQVAYEVFKDFCNIEQDVATCFYTALLSDTRYFTTSNMNKEVFQLAYDLVDAGAKPEVVSFNLTQRRPLSSLRILERALESLTLYGDAKIAILSITKQDILSTGATMPDVEGIVDYVRSLATVEVAVFAMELEDDIKFSLRSKKIDLTEIAMHFKGGGHSHAAGFTIKNSSLQESIDTILVKIKELGIVNEKKK